MPIYEFTDPKGRTLEIEGPRAPSVDDVRAMFAKAYPEPVAPAADGGGVLGTFKKGGTAVLEFLGRPGEFVSGFTGGALQGGLGEGLRRGTAALLEPNFTDSQIQEGFSKVLEEQGVLADSPKARALAGFVGDVLFDPTNLLGGAGLIRGGLIKGAHAVAGAKAGAKAEQALTASNRAFATVMTPVAQATKEAGAKLPGVRALYQNPDLVSITGRSGRTADETKRLYKSEQRNLRSMRAEELEKIMAPLSPAQRQQFKDQLLPAMAADPVAVQAMAADPKLATALADVGTLGKTLFGAGKVAGVQPLTFDVTLTPKLQKTLDALPPAAMRRLTDALQNGTALPPKLQGVADDLVKRISAKDGTELYKRETLQFAKDPKTGKVVVSADTEAKNYFPAYLEGPTAPGATVFRPTKASMQEAKNKLSYPEFAKTPGAVRDAEEAWQRYINSSTRAEASAKYLQDLAQDFGSATPQQGFSQLPATVQKDLQGLPALAPIASMYFPKAVADDSGQSLVKLTDAETMEGIFRRSLKLFKAFATSLNVGAYAAKNFVGNPANMHLAGMSPAAIVTEMTRAYNGVLSTEKILKDTSKSRRVFKLSSMTDQEVMEAARRNGITGRTSGFEGEFAPPDKLTPTAQALMTGRYNPLNPEMKIYNQIRGSQQAYIEDPAKLALFVHELRQGKSVPDATLTVKKYLFDYAELSDAERKIAGNLVPFYTWTRKNVPLWMGALATKPGKVNQQQNLVQLFTEAFPEEDPSAYGIPEARIPTYLQRPGTIPLPSSGANPLRGKLAMPYLDVLRPFEIAGDPRQAAADMLNPLIKIPIELGVLGERLNRGRISTGMGTPTPLGELLGLTREMPGTGQRVQSNLSRYLTEQIPVIPSALRPFLTEPAGSTVPTWQRAIYAALGLSPQELTPEVRQRALDALKRRQGEERARLRDQRLQQLLDTMP